MKNNEGSESFVLDNDSKKKDDWQNKLGDRCSSNVSDYC